MGIGMQKCLAIDDPADMPFPEPQIASLGQRTVVEQVAKVCALQIAVTGTGDVAGKAGRLNKTGTIDTQIGVPTPEIRRTEEQLRDGDRISKGPIERAQMLLRNEALTRLEESLAFIKNAYTLPKEQSHQIYGH